MDCKNGCELPATRYVEHYRTLGASRIYPEGKTGSGLVCERCGAHHAAGYEAYESYLATPPADRTFPNRPAPNTAPPPPNSGPPPESDEDAATSAPEARSAGRGTITLSLQWLIWLVDAILALVRRKTPG